MPSEHAILNQTTMSELGALYRGCVGASKCKELQKAVALMSNVDLGTLGVLLTYVTNVIQNMPDKDTAESQQETLDFG